METVVGQWGRRRPHQDSLSPLPLCFEATHPATQDPILIPAAAQSRHPGLFVPLSIDSTQSSCANTRLYRRPALCSESSHSQRQQQQQQRQQHRFQQQLRQQQAEPTRQHAQYRQLSREESRQDPLAAANLIPINRSRHILPSQQRTFAFRKWHLALPDGTKSWRP